MPKLAIMIQNETNTLKEQNILATFGCLMILCKNGKQEFLEINK